MKAEDNKGQSRAVDLCLHYQDRTTGNITTAPPSDTDSCSTNEQKTYYKI